MESSYTQRVRNKHPLGRYDPRHNPDSKKDKRREKNWLRTPGDPRIYYRDTYNINLFDYKVRRRFDVRKLPNYQYGYYDALKIRQRYLQRQQTMIMEDVTHKADANVRYSINDKDRDILNAPDTFLRRTPPPDNTTISDLSYVSAADSLETIIYSIYPPTPAHDQ
ncbi:hypothetical protein GLOIN_2v1478203 [Rhizophagus irregularis DAOM 181602=DAOM 197198]|nr:hypothetical protein GLOIN_2v1478203 [Rhizophagus irregularis DAOM 181602=DAOM 197198]